MKKIVLLSAFLVLLIQNGFTQERDLRFGFQASPNFAWLDTDDSDVNGSGSNLGLKLGLITEYYFRENYAVTAGLGFGFNHGGQLLFEERGQYWEDTEVMPKIDTSMVKLRYSIQYVEVPVGLRLQTREFGYFRYFLNPGLTFGFKSKATGDVQYLGFEEDGILLGREANALAVSWGVGGGAEYSVSTRTAIQVGLYYQRIFTDITDDKSTGTINGQQEATQAFSNNITVRIGVMF